MSADNGVYILPVHSMEWSNKNQHYEETAEPIKYLVFHMQAIDNATYEADRKDGYSNAWIIRFLMSNGYTSYKTKDQAIKAAYDAAEQIDILEYGVSTLQKMVLYAQ
jgi:hypothetical protein